MAAVVVSIEAPDPTKVALLGLVAVGVPRSFYLRRPPDHHLSGAGLHASGVS
jgi:hypothetical protein